MKTVGQRVTLMPGALHWIKNRSGIVTSLTPSGRWANIKLDGNVNDSAIKTEYLMPVDVDVMLATIAAVHGDDEAEMMTVEMADKAKRRGVR